MLNTSYANTVVVGQKVHAKIETIGKVSVDNTYGVQWAQPTGGDVVRNYVTNDSEGRVVTLEETYFNTNYPKCYYTNDLEFYYTSKTANAPNASGALANLTAYYNVRSAKGATAYQQLAGAAYYVVAPTTYRLSPLPLADYRTPAYTFDAASIMWRIPIFISGDNPGQSEMMVSNTCRSSGKRVSLSASVTLSVTLEFSK